MKSRPLSYQFFTKGPKLSIEPAIFILRAGT
jgi:hypothetical protein